MPPRLARSSVQTAAPQSARNKNKKRNLNAYSIASHSTPAKKQVRQHRLGEYLDDRPAPKRRRDSEDDDVAALDDEDLRGTAKRRKAAFASGDVEEGSDSEGNEWTLGGLAEDDDDSDLDSEEAFGESDEEKFEGFTFRGSKSRKKPVKRNVRQGVGDADIGSGVDLYEAEGAVGEDDEEEEDDFGDEGVDLATMLDDGEAEEPGGAEDSGSEEEEGESESHSDSEDDQERQGDDDDERNARMRDRLEALDGDQPAAKPRQTAQQKPLSVDDLLAGLDPSAKKQFAAATKMKKRSERPTTLAAPLPKRQQDRLNREVASQKAKEQLDRWRDTVIQNRRAEFLSFPLKDPDQGEPLGKDKFLHSKPQNELEANIQRIMEESGMAPKDGGAAEDEEDAIMKAEGMAEQKMDVDEVMQRRAELRKTRELLFYEERKAKRIAKIKSKSYRRVHRREKAREAERQREEREELGLEPMDEGEREQQDRRRAEERMGTKHRDSKWAKQLKQTNRATWDEGARDSVNEEARRREELRRRVEGQNVGSDESEEDFEEADGDGDAVTLRQLDGLKRGGNDGKERKGLAGMKFMRDADARRKAQNDEDVERMRKELAIEDGDEVDSGDEVDDQGLGRAIFGPQGSKASGKIQPKKMVKGPEMEEGSTSEGEDGGDQDGDVEIVTESKDSSAKKQPQFMPKKANGAKSGPLARSNGQDRKDPYGSVDAQDDQNNDFSWYGKGKKGARNSQAVDEEDQQLLRPAASEGKIHIKAARADDLPVLQDLHKQVATRNSEPATESAGNSNGWTVVKYADQDAASDSDSGDNREQPILTPAEQNNALQRAAFAGDDVEAQFRADKAAQEASEDEQEEPSTHLPGWGSWTGSGLSKSIRKANAAAKAKAKSHHHPLFKNKAAPAVPGVKPGERRDAKMPQVIVSEKGDRKGKKYLAGQLPRGFERREEYERSLRRPVGEEWGTKEVVQRNTRPRVVVGKGTVVEAMERPGV